MHAAARFCFKADEHIEQVLLLREATIVAPQAGSVLRWKVEAADRRSEPVECHKPVIDKKGVAGATQTIA